MCDCIKQINAATNEQFEKHLQRIPKAVITEKAEIKTCALVFNAKQCSQVFAPAEGRYKIGKQSRKWEANLSFQYCPFCGNKYE